MVGAGGELEGNEMKTKLRITQHSLLGGESVVEVWHNGAYVAEVTGADQPGVRIISKHPLSARRMTDGFIEVLEVAIGNGNGN
jgi:hypothetical protein